jgi:integrase
MGRVNAKERARKRILSDDEIRAVWTAAEASTGPFGPYVMFLLLTGARRTEARLMTRGELSGRDWLLPARRNKTKVDFMRPLSGAAMDVIKKLPRIGRADGFVFTLDGQVAFGNQWRLTADLQKKSGTSAWTLHDLRRTARSLMSRAGVSADHAEICLGHLLPGVRGIYDRHEYYDEKLRAFEALACLIDRIVNPPADVVVPLRPAG